MEKTLENGKDMESKSLMKDAEMGSPEVEIETDPNQRLLYKAADHPPIYISIFCGFQVTFLQNFNKYELVKLGWFFSCLMPK